MLTRHLIAAACLLATVITVTTTAAAQDRMRPILEEGGIWHGVGVQVGELHWPIEVELSAEAPKLRYPSFGCEGTWQVLRVEDDEMLGIETIQEGRETCSSGGVIRLRVLDDARLAYAWFDGEGDAAARAVLVRGRFDDAHYEALLNMTMTELDMGFLSRETPPAPTPEL